MYNELCYVCNILNKYKVEYLIIGGTAVNLYGSDYNLTRKTLLPNGEESDRPDIDIWIGSSYEHYYKNIIFSLKELKFKDYKNPGMNPKYWVFTKSFDLFDLDISTFREQINSDFKECYTNRNIVEIKDINIDLISLDDLISIKSDSNRYKDKNDLKTLIKIKSMLI